MVEFKEIIRMAKEVCRVSVLDRLVVGFRCDGRALALGVSMAIVGSALFAENPAQGPNIIYILADDLGYGEVGFNGQEKILTPALDRLAEEGLVFSHHYAGASVCGPSRGALMTGKSQAVGFIKNNPGGDWRRENLPGAEITLAEKMKEAGYATSCIGKWAIGPRGKSGYPLNQGFDEFLGYDTHVAAHNYYPRTLCYNDGTLTLDENAGIRKGQTGATYTHDLFTAEALKYIERDHGNPFFLYLAYAIPHSPYNPPDVEPYTDKDWTLLQKKYAAMITRMDRDIGKVINALRANGIEENTLVVFSSDNGTSAPGLKRKALPGKDFFRSSGPLRGTKRDLFEGGVRVPTVFWWPGRIVPGETDHVSAFQDIMPTFCDLTGVSHPEGIDGISMLPTLLGKTREQESHEFLYWEFCVMRKEGGRQGAQAILDAKNWFKAIRETRSGDAQLYDLRSDPVERDNIASQFPEIAKRMVDKMDTVRGPSELWPVFFFE